MPAEPLRQVLLATGRVDADVRRALRTAAREAEKIIAGLEPGSVRRAQLELAALQAEAWGNIESSIRTGAEDAARRQARLQAVLDSDLLRRVPACISAGAWRESMEQTAQAGIRAYLSRRQNHFTLSERVYRNRALSRGYVERTINNGLILGKSVKEIAADVKQYINPDVAGGQSYAAMRLARTEVVNAYHHTARTEYAETPWVDRARWNLSGSHGKPDVCNEYAEQSQFRGGAVGVFLADEVPDKPHPQCLCYITPLTVGLDTFVSEFKSGKYDGYLNNQLGTSDSVA